MTDEIKGAIVVAENVGTDPLMERSFGWILGTVPKRLLTLATKMMSMKGVVFVTATFLVREEVITEWTWLASTLVLIFGEKALTMIKELRG